MSTLTKAATRGDLAWIERTLKGTHIVDSHDSLVRMFEADPWQIRVSDRREVAVLGSWRAHLSICAIFGLFCPPKRIPALVADLEDVAREHGFARLMGPLVPEPAVRPYLDAGLAPYARIVVMHLERIGSPACDAAAMPDGVTARVAQPADAPAVLAVDAASFEDFWRQDDAGIERYAGLGRVTIAERDGRAVGYTLATVRDGGGSLGRLAVIPDERGRGIGRALTCESLAWMASEGVRSVTLSTQESNAVSRGLYRSVGFRESPIVLVAAISAPLTGGDEA